MRLAIAAAVLFCATSASAEHVSRYSVVFSGKTNGTQTTTVGDDGRIVVDYTYRNNGRGPDLREETVLAADGTQVSYSAKGKSTFGSPIEETFQRAGERGTWQTLAGRGMIDISSLSQNRSQRGGQAHFAPRTPQNEPVPDGSAVYVPESILSECSPESTAIIMRAVLRSASRSFAALPGGTLSAEKVKDTAVDTADGRVDVSLYALNGLTTHPVFVWLTSDDSHRLFASISPGNRQIVIAGSESQGDRLEKLQIEAENEMLAEIAKRVTHRFPEPFVFRNVRVFDSSSGTRSEPCDVYVARGRIAAIYPAGSKAQEAGASVDGAGQTLMPGLFDMHAHEDAWNSLLQIAGGVTTARDMGNDNPYLTQLMARIEAGELVGPRIVPCGFIEGQSPFSARNGKVVDSLQAAQDAVDWYAQRGYRQIKIYNSFHPDWARPIAAYAHERGLRVSGHVPAFMKAEQVVAAGYDEIQHINQVLLNFVVGPQDDTRTLARFTLIADKIHALDLESPEVRQFIAKLKEHDVAIDATAAVFEANFTQMQGETNPSYGVVEAHVPVALRRQWLVNSMDLNASNAETWRASYSKMLDFIGLMHREGVPLVAGTDDIAGFTLHRELELYAKAGIPAPEVLRIATHNGAKFTGTLDSLGSVKPARLADLILIAGDPTSNISDIRRVSLVMKAGSVYFPAEIYEAVGVQRFVDPPAITVTK